MERVAAQGDTAADGGEQREAMDDLRRILAGRAAFYSKADAAFDTSGQAAGASVRRRCATWCASALRLPDDAARATMQ